MKTGISTYYNLRTLLLLITSFVVHYLSVLFFLPFLYSDTNIVPIWPAVGIAFSAILLFDIKIWPVLLISSFTANVSFLLFNGSYTAPVTFLISGIEGTADTLQVLLGFFLLKRVGLEVCKMDKVKYIFHFTAIVLICCLAGAILKTSAHVILGVISFDSFLISGFGTWLANSIGILLIVPMLLGWTFYTGKTEEKSKDALGTVFFGALTFIVSGVVFCNWFDGLHFIKPYMVIPLFIWAAFYFELKALTIIIAISSFVSIYGTLSGLGYFVSGSIVESYTSLQLYIAIITVTTLVIKATLNERKYSAEALQVAHDKLLVNMKQRSEELHNYQGRINAIFKTLVKYTIMDFSEKVPISDQCDEIDAIGTGLNTLGEELAASNTAQLKYASELEQTNLLLIDSEHQVQSIFNNAPDGVIVIDSNGIVLRWNPQAEASFGWKKDEVIGKSIYDFIVAEHHSAVNFTGINNFDTNGDEGAINKSFEIDALNKGGEMFPLSLSVSPVMMGGRHMFICFARNVNEQKKAEKKIKQLAAIVESSDDAIISQAFDGTILSWNKAAETIYGYSAKEVVGQLISITSPPELLPDLKSIPFRLQQGEQIINIETQKLRKNGERIYVSLTASAIRDNQGNTTAISLISRDITENKKNALEMLRITEELKRSNAELEQFAYVASHDLQEPLRMVTSYLQLLEKRYKEQLDSDAFEFIAFAVDGSNRMRNLIHSLLEYSRINRIKPFEWIDTKELINDVLLNLQTSIAENKAVITIRDMPQIYGDYVLINQLFQNLIANAIKFRNETVPKIVISASETEEEYVFSIADNGIGIQAEYVEKIFVIFKRLHSKEKYPGTGMGLAICKKIVERHNGKIWVESVPENGSVFYFTLKKRR
ncbi:MAG: PAS domain S-box protein [Bacteroidia bacterium]